MRDVDSALVHDLAQASVIQLVSEIPPDAQDDYRAIKVAALEPVNQVGV
jgi:hypothetical protein